MQPERGPRDRARRRTDAGAVVAARIAVVDAIACIHRQSAAASTQHIFAGVRLLCAADRVAADQAGEEYVAGGRRVAAVDFAVGRGMQPERGPRDRARRRTDAGAVIAARIAVVDAVACIHRQRAAVCTQYVFAGVRLPCAADRVAADQAGEEYVAGGRRVAAVDFAVGRGMQPERGPRDRARRRTDAGAVIAARIAVVDAVACIHRQRAAARAQHILADIRLARRDAVAADQAGKQHAAGRRRIAAVRLAASDGMNAERGLRDRDDTANRAEIGIVGSIGAGVACAQAKAGDACQHMYPGVFARQVAGIARAGHGKALSRHADGAQHAAVDRGAAVIHPRARQRQVRFVDRQISANDVVPLLAGVIIVVIISRIGCAGGDTGNTADGRAGTAAGAAVVRHENIGQRQGFEEAGQQGRRVAFVDAPHEPAATSSGDAPFAET